MRTIETIPDYLNRMARKEISRGYDGDLPGLRTTQEIAEYFNLSLSAARQILGNLADSNLITGYDRCDGLVGRPYLWGPWVSSSPDPDDGEPMPVNDNEELLAING